MAINEIDARMEEEGDGGESRENAMEALSIAGSDDASTAAEAASSTETTATATTTSGGPPVASNNNNDEEGNAATQKRKAIQSIMKDATLTDLERRLKIQQLMDGSSKPESHGSGIYAGNRAAVSGFGGEGGGGLFGSGGFFGGGGGVGSRTSTTVDLAGIRTTGAGAPISSLYCPLASSSGSSGRGRGGNNGNNQFVSSNNNNSNRNEPTVPPCVHYERKCYIVAPCCQQLFGCRVCHDEMTAHTNCGPMDRFKIEEVVCKECHTRQGSKTNQCIKCKVTFAEYHCSKCNIWMALSKRPFHCDQCGFCRVGGRENFRHCTQCCMCISATIYDTHNCMQDKYKNNCPVCREDMFSSRQSPVDLPCGHAIHTHCFRNLSDFDYRCPICKKTVVSRASMSAAWSARARDIELQPMPEDLAQVVNIMCNDCEVKSENCNWHFLGVQCPSCQSFNTVVEGVVSSPARGGD